jgi:hypothetical protein
MSRMEWLAYIGPGVGASDGIPWHLVARVALLLPLVVLGLGVVMLASGQLLSFVGSWLVDHEPPPALRLGPQRTAPPRA